MHGAGHTRHTLILRLHDPKDADAWNQFVVIYEPLVHRLARRMGMGEADALDATQEVLLHLTNVVGQWQPDSKLGSFRGWLYRVARNVMLRYLERGRKDVKATGASDIQDLLREWPDDEQTQEFDLEFRRQVFAWAVQQVRTQFSGKTWDVFWLTYVQHEPIATAASELGISIGAAYIARSRVLKQLRETVQRQIDHDWSDLGVDSSEVLSL